MQCKQMLPLMWCSSSEQRGASDVACCVFHQASSWVSLLNGAYWAANRMVWKQVCLVSWQPSWGVLWSGRGSARVHGGFTPSASTQAVPARRLRYVTLSFYSFSLPSKAVSASMKHLTAEMKTLNHFLAQMSLCMKFPCLKLSPLLWSWRHTARLVCFQSFSLGRREGHNRGNLQCAQLEEHNTNRQH